VAANKLRLKRREADRARCFVWHTGAEASTYLRACPLCLVPYLYLFLSIHPPTPPLPHPPTHPSAKVRRDATDESVACLVHDGSVLAISLGEEYTGTYTGTKYTGTKYTGTEYTGPARMGPPPPALLEAATATEDQRHCRAQAANPNPNRNPNRNPIPNTPTLSLTLTPTPTPTLALLQATPPRASDALSHEDRISRRDRDRDRDRDRGREVSAASSVGTADVADMVGLGLGLGC
jgi:hypothetical protein